MYSTGAPVRAGAFAWIFACVPQAACREAMDGPYGPSASSADSREVEFSGVRLRVQEAGARPSLRTAASAGTAAFLLRLNTEVRRRRPET